MMKDGEIFLYINQCIPATSDGLIHEKGFCDCNFAGWKGNVLAPTCQIYAKRW